MTEEWQRNGNSALVVRAGCQKVANSSSPKPFPRNIERTFIDETPGQTDMAAQLATPPAMDETDSSRP
jgi:hypothetical protein